MVDLNDGRARLSIPDRKNGPVVALPKQRAHGARDRDHVRAGFRERDRHGAADSARRAGDHGDAVGEGAI